jgi:pSer/pThr/pTyr-binding forkhead associated (FHA) protein
MSLGLLVRIPEQCGSKAPPLVMLTQPSTTIGRHGDVQMDTPAGHEVSKHHATIYRHNQRDTHFWVVEDNHSVNGAFVNRMKIHRRILSPGDEIVFGAQPRFSYGDFLQSTHGSSCRYLFLIASFPDKGRRSPGCVDR